MHAALLVIVPGCLIAAWWQLHQALDGNSLSWAYTFEWPCFAVIATVAWWHLIHEDPAQRAVRLRPDLAAAGAAPAAARTADPDDEPVWSPDMRRRVAMAARREYLAHVERQLADWPGATGAAAPGGTGQ